MIRSKDTLRVAEAPTSTPHSILENFHPEQVMWATTSLKEPRCVLGASHIYIISMDFISLPNTKLILPHLYIFVKG